MIETHIPALIALNFLTFAVLIPLVGIWRARYSQTLAVVGSGISAGLSLYGFLYYLDSMPLRYFFGGWEAPIGIEFVYDGLSAFVVLVINVIAFIVLIHSKPISLREFPGKLMAYYTVTMLLMLGFNGMVLTGDLFNLYVLDRKSVV